MHALATGHRDPLEQLNRCIPLLEKVRAVHRVIQERLDDIDRIAAALHDPRSDLVKTFLVSAAADDLPLHHYEARLSECPSLREILRTGRPRVIDDLPTRRAVTGNAATGHASASQQTAHLVDLGYASSYTMPMFCHGLFRFPVL